MDLVRRAGAVDRDDPLRKPLGQEPVAGAHGCMETRALGLDSIARGAPSSRRGLERDVDDHRAMGEESIDADFVQAKNRVDPEPAGGTLIGERGVDESVAHDPLPSRQGGGDHLANQLGASGGEQLSLGGEADGAGAKREHEVSDLLPDIRAPGLTCLDDFVTPRPQRVDE